MLLIDKQKFVQGVNFRMGYSYKTLTDYMHTNAQYIIELAKELKMYSRLTRSSFSITSLAIHITHLFFHFNSYRYFDRFVASC